MSNLTSCPDCNHQVSRSAAKCPNCGRITPNPSMLIVKVMVVLLGGLFFFGWIQYTLTAPGSLERQFQPLTDAADEATRCIQYNICKPVPSP